MKDHFFEYSDSNNSFVSDFPFYNVLEEVKKNIPSSKAVSLGIADDVYYFKYNNCGRYNKKIQNYFKVVCFHDTNKIITMYPILFGENTDYIDLNYMISNNENNYENDRNDMISRFYKRYNKRKS